MTATATTPPVGRHTAPPAESPFTGVGALLRLALRRDRIRLAVWISLLTLTAFSTPGALELTYPDEPQRLARIEVMRTPAGIMLAGPMFGMNETALGAMVASELMLTLIIATSILAILTVIRHTRAEEESGAAELVLSSVIGRYARTFAALILIAAVNAVLAVAMMVALAATGLDVLNAAGMCLAIAAVAVVFGALAAVTAQLWRQSRIATGAAMAVLASAALVRGVGDVVDNAGSTLSWFSPIAWAQQMRAFVELRWWPLAMLITLALALMMAAAALESKREYDGGNFPSRGDRPNAPAVGGVFGLHLRLQRGQLIGWSVGLFLSGLAAGSMIQSLIDAAADNELLAQMLAVEGYDGVHTAMTQFLAAAACVFVVAAIARVYRDEESGLGEAVLAGAVSRGRWLLSAVAAALLGATVLMVATGVGHGLGTAAALGEAAPIWRLTLAALAQLPALAVIAGVAALGVALRRPILGWLAVTFVVVSLYLGPLLRFPQWLIEASPVGQTTVPKDLSVVALAVMAVSATALTMLAGWIYRRRDAV